MSNHTFGPWKYTARRSPHGDIGKITGPDGEVLITNEPHESSQLSEDDMRWIVACVNVCVGIPAKEIEYISGGSRDSGHGIAKKYFDAVALRKDLAEVTAQRDALLAAVKQTAYEDNGEYYIRVNSGQSFGPLKAIKAAIAKCEVHI